MSNYIALIRKTAESDYSVEFPDVPGCFTAGRTLDEAQAFAREALAGHLELLAVAGDPLPEPRRLEPIISDPEAEAEGAVAVLVPAPLPKGKAVRVNVMIDEYLLIEIDRAAGTRGRSEFLCRAAKRELARS